MEDKNQEENGKNLPVDRWICNYECKKCRHFCGSVSNNSPNETLQCKTCHTHLKPVSEVSESMEFIFHSLLNFQCYLLNLF